MASQGVGPWLLNPAKNDGREVVKGAVVWLPN